MKSVIKSSCCKAEYMALTHELDMCIRYILDTIVYCADDLIEAAYRGIYLFQPVNHCRLSSNQRSLISYLAFYGKVLRFFRWMLFFLEIRLYSFVVYTYSITCLFLVHLSSVLWLRFTHKMRKTFFFALMRMIFSTRIKIIPKPFSVFSMCFPQDGPFKQR